MFWDSYVIYMCVMDIMNVLCTGTNMSISRIRIMGMLQVNLKLFKFGDLGLQSYICNI